MELQVNSNSIFSQCKSKVSLRAVEEAHIRHSMHLLQELELHRKEVGKKETFLLVVVGDKGKKVGK